METSSKTQLSFFTKSMACEIIHIPRPKPPGWCFLILQAFKEMVYDENHRYHTNVIEAVVYVHH